jgi:hypothetical protein
MDTAAIQGLHGAFGGTGVVVLNETVVVTLGLQKPVSMQVKKKKTKRKNFRLGKKGGKASIGGPILDGGVKEAEIDLHSYPE